LLHVFFFPFHRHFLTQCSSFSRYIHRELIVNNALPPSCLPSFLLDWVDVNSNLCVYMAMQVVKFPHVHLVAGGWYLDCSRGFVPVVEESLYNTLVSSAPEVIELEEEPDADIPAPPSIDKDVAPAKGKAGVGRFSPMRLLKYPLVLTPRPPFNALLLQPPPWLEVLPPLLLPLPSLLLPLLPIAGATIPSVPRKRKVVAPNTSATSSERSSSLYLIENVDMRELIEDLIKMKVPPPAYRRIQEFLTKVCMPFSCFVHSFNSVPHSVFYLDFIWILAFQVGAGRTRRNTKPKVHTGLDLLFADVPENLRVPILSSSSSDVPQWNKCSPIYFEVFFAFANANLHDDSVLVFADVADVSRSIHN
jgi:hypothetical protein